MSASTRLGPWLNGGGARLELQTSGGNIRIRLD